MLYANEESDDVIGGPTKTVLTLDQSFSNLAPEIYITKERKWHLSCHVHDNTCNYAAGPVLMETKIPRFYLKQGSSTYNNMGTIMCIQSKILCSTWKGCKCGYLVLHWKRLKPNIVGVILFRLWCTCTFLVPSLKNTAPIFLEIFLIQYFIV